MARGSEVVLGVRGLIENAGAEALNRLQRHVRERAGPECLRRCFRCCLRHSLPRTTRTPTTKSTTEIGPPTAQAISPVHREWIDKFPLLSSKSLCYMTLRLAVNRSGGYFSRFRVSDIVINTGVLRDRATGRKQVGAGNSGHPQRDSNPIAGKRKGPK